MRTRWIQTLAAALAAALALAVPAGAQDQNAGGPAEWLMRYTSARTLGLGGAYVALSDDPLGVLWNPAGLSAMNENELRFENAQLFEDTQLNTFGLAVPGSRLPTFGLTFVSLRSGDFQRTNDMNDPLGSFSESKTAWLFTASKALSTRFALGVNLKLAQQAVEEFRGGGFGVDVGATFAATDALRLGVSVASLGGPTMTLDATDETWPTLVRGGGVLTVLGGRGLITAEMDQSNGLGVRFHGGTEYWIQPGFALRIGYDHDHGAGGFGWRFSRAYQVDYAVADHPLGMTHRLGLSWRFGGFNASALAEPSMFSPTGENAVTKVSLYSRTKAEPASWALDIVNKTDQIVRRFGGQGQPPSHVQWDGKDETGLPLPDGTYSYSLVVQDKAGRTVAGPARTIEISTLGPQGAVPLVPQTAR
jgi:hypothetical protein